VLIVVALIVALPRMRERARLRAREKELGERREQVATQHREASQRLDERAEVAERHARIAEQEAARERAAAQVRQERAELHEQGLADHELISDDERDRFAGTSAVEDGRGEVAADGSRGELGADGGRGEVASGRDPESTDADRPAARAQAAGGEPATNGETGAARTRS
jgi:hypothetical protein